MSDWRNRARRPGRAAAPAMPVPPDDADAIIERQPDHHRNLGDPVARVFTATAVSLAALAGIGATFKPWCPDQLCRDTSAAVSENRPTFPIDHPPGVTIYPVSVAGTTSASAVAETFQGGTLTLSRGPY